MCTPQACRIIYRQKLATLLKLAMYICSYVCLYIAMHCMMHAGTDLSRVASLVSRQVGIAKAAKFSSWRMTDY